MNDLIPSAEPDEIDPGTGREGRRSPPKAPGLTETFPLSVRARSALLRRGARLTGAAPSFEADPEVAALRLAARGDFDSFTPATLAASSSWAINALKRALSQT